MIVLARIAALLTLVLTSTSASVTFASDIQGRGLIPAFEVTTIIRSMGFDPAGPAVLRGPVYVIRAVDDDDVPLRITVDARSGRVITVTEVAPNETARIGAYPVPPGRVPSVPDYRPSAIYGSPAPLLPQAAPPPIRQSAVTPRTPTPRPRPAQTAAPETTASIPGAPATPGKSIPAPVAKSAAPPSSSGSGSDTGEAAPKTETPMVPVAPLE